MTRSTYCSVCGGPVSVGWMSRSEGCRLCWLEKQPATPTSTTSSPPASKWFLAYVEESRFLPRGCVFPLDLAWITQELLPPGADAHPELAAWLYGARFVRPWMG